MTKLFLAALMIWALPFSALSCGPATVQDSQPKNTDPTPVGESVTLTNEHPSGSFPVEKQLLINPPEILEVQITKVVNSAATPLNIFAYLTTVGEKGKPEPEKIVVGNFSLYPADRPGKFMLGPAAAFRKLNEMKTVSNTNELQLVLEMQRVDETRPWTALELTFAPPNWRSKEK